MEQPLSPREFVKRYSLPQLVRIHNAHLHQLNTHRVSNKAVMKSGEKNNHSNSDHSGSLVSSDAKKQEKKKASTVGKLSSKHFIKRSSDANEGVNDVNLLDIDQPFLLYKSYTSRQITAHTLTPDSSCDTANYKKTGPGLLIPENYPGKLHFTPKSTPRKSPRFSTFPNFAINPLPENFPDFPFSRIFSEFCDKSVFEHFRNLGSLSVIYFLIYSRFFPHFSSFCLIFTSFAPKFYFFQKFIQIQKMLLPLI